MAKPMLTTKHRLKTKYPQGKLVPTRTTQHKNNISTTQQHTRAHTHTHCLTKLKLYKGKNNYNTNATK